MSNKALTVGLVVVALIAIVGVFTPAESSLFGASGTRFPNGISADSTSPVAGELRGADLTLTDDAVIADDLTINGRALDVTSSNAATSSLTVGCIDGYATSTATPIKQMFMASTTLGGSLLSDTYTGGTAQGTVLWGYGSCS